MQAFNWQEYEEILGSRGIIGLDLETTGLNKNIEYERPTSAAILEANNDLNNPDIIINDKCRLPYHVLPDAGALNITNINPMQLMEEPLSLFELTNKIASYLKEYPEKIIATYNGASYDLIILRHSFFSSLINPYLLSNASDDRIHIDLYNVAQAIYCFEPTSIAFHKDVTGKLILKQELLAIANGIDPGDAHAALDDVKVLLKLAKLFEQNTPRIFFSAIASGNKKRAINLMTKQLFFNYGEVKYKERLAVKRTPTFICEDPSYSNNLVHFDLTYDPIDYVFMTAEEIAPKINRKGSPFFTIKSNKSPVILPGELCEKNGLSLDEASKRAEMVQDNQGFKENVLMACDINSRKRPEWQNPDFPESQIYSDFIDNNDRLLSDTFLQTNNVEKRIEIMQQINDPRLIDFAKRILASEHPNCEPKIIMNFQEFEAERLLTEDEVPWRTLSDARRSLEGLESKEKKVKLNPDILSATKNYYNLVEEETRK